MNRQEEMRKAFIADIAANPEDIERRLIFADWLEDNGEPVRAAMIRCTGEVTVFGRGSEYTTMATATFCSAMWRMAEEDILRAVAVPGQLYVLPKQTVLRHGFIEEIHGPLNSLTKHLPRIVQEHPILSVRATDREPDLWAFGDPNQRQLVWRWHRSNNDHYSSLPDEVFLHLPPDDRGSSPDKNASMEWKAGEAVLAALSEALLKLARSKVVSPAAPA